MCLGRGRVVILSERHSSAEEEELRLLMLLRAAVADCDDCHDCFFRWLYPILLEDGVFPTGVKLMEYYHVVFCCRGCFLALNFVG